MKRSSTEEHAHAQKRTRQEVPVLGSKTKGAVYLVEKEKEKQPFGKYVYGNYQGYYTTRRKQGNALIDPRLDLIDPSYFVGKRILDIGCNSGNISIAIAKKYSVTSIDGVDIDEGLIKKAHTNLRVAYSLNHPDQQSPIDLSLRFHYFPQSMTNMFGMLPMAFPPSYKKPNEFPFNVHFEAMDWTETNIDKYSHYDTVLALSITKWIQLHGGDKGLKRFFKKVYDSLAPGGTFVLEPQEFNTFQRRAKQIDPTKDVEQELHFRPEDYEDYLINHVGFKEVINLGAPQGEIKGFSRPIILYIK